MQSSIGACSCSSSQVPTVSQGKFSMFSSQFKKSNGNSNDNEKRKLYKKKKKVSFSSHSSLPRINSILLLFDISENQIKFPLHLFIVNIILCVPVFITILTFLTIVCVKGKTPDFENDTQNEPEKHFGLPGLFYCAPFIIGSLSIELGAQLIYMLGSILLIIGTRKNLKSLCYTYIVCTLTSFLMASTIRTLQVVICEKRKIPWRKKYFQLGLPFHFNLLFIWLIAQLFWYLLMFSLVDALLKWWRVEDYRKRSQSQPRPSNIFNHDNHRHSSIEECPQTENEIVEA